jgi:hypothetical protein
MFYTVTVDEINVVIIITIIIIRSQLSLFIITIIIIRSQLSLFALYALPLPHFRLKHLCFLNFGTNVHAFFWHELDVLYHIFEIFVIVMPLQNLAHKKFFWH